MSEKHFLTTSNVTGVASAAYDTVIFTCNVQGTGLTGPKAKEAARPAIDALIATLDALEKDGLKIDREGLRAEPNVQPAYDYDSSTRRNTPVGYTASYTLTFQSCSVESASEVHDKLTEVNGVTANAPAFKLKNLTKLHSRALRDAKAKRDARFKDECKVFGLDPDDYCVDSYQPSYDESESAGAQLYAHAAASHESVGGGSPVKIKSGRATVTVRLTSNYRLRGVSILRPATSGASKSSKSGAKDQPASNGGDATS